MPIANASVASHSARGPSCCGTASAKIIENITAIETGSPRLPQAAPRNATKLATTSSTVSHSASARSSCTAQNSGTPKTAAGTSCASLPRRGETWSGGVITITPTAAVAAASGPRKPPTIAATSGMPSAVANPLVTYELSATRAALRSAVGASCRRGIGAIVPARHPPSRNSAGEVQLDAVAGRVVDEQLLQLRAGHRRLAVVDAERLQLCFEVVDAGAGERDVIERAGGRRRRLLAGNFDEMHDRRVARVQPVAGKLERRAPAFMQADHVDIEVAHAAKQRLAGADVVVVQAESRHGARYSAARRSMEVAARRARLRAQPPQHRREVFQRLRNDVAHVAAAFDVALPRA